MYEPGIVVRRVSPNDLDRLIDLVRRFYLFNEEFNPLMELTEKYHEVARQVLESRLGEGNIFLLADHDGEIAGYVYGVVEENMLLRLGSVAVVKELYVAPLYRNRGVATQLLNEFSSTARSMGVSIVAAEFPSANYVARNFYEKNGFKEFRSIYMKVL